MMKLKKRFIVSTMLYVMLLIFSGCQSPYPEITGPTWDTIDGWERFSLNDTEYYNYSFWKKVENSDGNGTPEIQVQKIAGAKNFGYGIIFAIQPDGSFYRILIGVEGLYKVSHVYADGTSYTIKDWTSNSNIKTGYSTVNIIRVEYISDYEPEDGNSYPSYDIYINDIYVFGWYNSSGTMLLDGKSGFIAFAGDEESEDFPDTPVDVRFKMINPVTFP